MTLAQIKADGYKIFGRQSDKGRQQNIKAIQYIETLAFQNGVNISLWNLKDLFGAKAEGHTYITERNEINKIFFEALEKSKSDGSDDKWMERLTSTILPTIERSFKEKNTTHIEQLKDERRQYQRNYYEKTRQAQDYIVAAWGTYKKIQKAEAKKKPEKELMDQIVLVAKSIPWSFHDFDGNFISFISRTDYIVTEKTAAAGIDHRVNFGRFKVLIEVRTLNLQVLPFEKNLNISGVIHPHVGANGIPCYGNHNATMGDYQATGKLHAMMDFLHCLLGSYSPDNPHVALVSFQAIAPQDRPGGGDATDEQKVQTAQEMAKEAESGGGRELRDTSDNLQWFTERLQEIGRVIQEMGDTGYQQVVRNPFRLGSQARIYYSRPRGTYEVVWDGSGLQGLTFSVPGSIVSSGSNLGRGFVSQPRQLQMPTLESNDNFAGMAQQVDQLDAATYTINPSALEAQVNAVQFNGTGSPTMSSDLNRMYREAQDRRARRAQSQTRVVESRPGEEVEW